MSELDFLFDPVPPPAKDAARRQRVGEWTEAAASTGAEVERRTSMPRPAAQAAPRVHMPAPPRPPSKRTPAPPAHPPVRSAAARALAAAGQPPPVAPPSRPLAAGLRPVSDVPERFRHVFPYESFNPVQSRCLDVLLGSDENVVVGAPTGAGKTVLLELAICRQLAAGGVRKIVYMAPTKALCQERSADWTRKFGVLQQPAVRVAQITGDTDSHDLDEFRKADVIVTTPEKWDSITRRWRSKKDLVKCLGLVLVDEVHLVNETGRGACLETVVSRMKSYARLEDLGIRLVAVSATIPNAHDVAEWLDVKAGGLFRFDDSVRPVPLDKVVVGIRSKAGASNPYKFDAYCNYRMRDLIQTYSAGKQTLIFCPSRKSTSSTAARVADDMGAALLGGDAARRARLMDAARRCTNAQLRDLVPRGVAFHNASLEPRDRANVEALFLHGDLLVLATTSTLATGVNLPARLVIIKGTSFYNNGSNAEYSELNLLQMMGRAGRPQFDDRGTCVIVTTSEQKAHYDELVSGTVECESSLHCNIVEHLNAEIVLGTVRNLDMAMVWITSTFLYVRMRRAPAKYGLALEQHASSAEALQAHLRALLRKFLRMLAEHHMCSLDERDGAMDVEPLPAGISMAKFYVAFETMKSFVRIDGTSTLQDVLTVLASATEFGSHAPRMEERAVLNRINERKSGGDLPAIRWPLARKVRTSGDKTSVMIQAALADIAIDDWSLRSQLMTVTSSAQRILRCMLADAQQRGLLRPAFHVLTLSKCIRQRMWETSERTCKQLEHIGPSLSAMLERADAGTFERLAELREYRIEAICGRNHPFGVNVRAALRALPAVVMHVSESDDAGLASHRRRFLVQVRPNEALSDGEEKPDARFQLLVGSGPRLLVTRPVRGVAVDIPLDVIRAPVYDFLLVSERYVGLDLEKRYACAERTPGVFTAGKKVVPWAMVEAVDPMVTSAAKRKAQGKGKGKGKSKGKGKRYRQQTLEETERGGPSLFDEFDPGIVAAALEHDASNVLFETKGTAKTAAPTTTTATKTATRTPTTTPGLLALRERTMGRLQVKRLQGGAAPSGASGGAGERAPATSTGKRSRFF